MARCRQPLAAHATALGTHYTDESAPGSSCRSCGPRANRSAQPVRGCCIHAGRRSPAPPAARPASSRERNVGGAVARTVQRHRPMPTSGRHSAAACVFSRRLASVRAASPSWPASASHGCACSPAGVRSGQRGDGTCILCQASLRTSNTLGERIRDSRDRCQRAWAFTSESWHHTRYRSCGRVG